MDRLITIAENEARAAAELLISSPDWMPLYSREIWLMNLLPSNSALSSAVQQCRDRITRWHRARWLVTYAALLDCDPCVLHALAHAVQHIN